jgi:NADH-quinone oxidoreductase subunit M
MHNRVGPGAASVEISWRDGLVVTPLVAAIIALAFYPQLPLHKGEKSVTQAVSAAAERTGATVQADATGSTTP